MIKIPFHLHRSGHYAIGEDTSDSPEIVLVNPEDRDGARHRFILGFGAYGDMRLMIWSCGIEDALEIAAEWLAKHAPGHIMLEWSDEHRELCREACEEDGLAWPIPNSARDDDELMQRYQDACDAAVTDCTYTESGYLTSYEWTIVAEDPDRADLEDMVYPRDRYPAIYGDYRPTRANFWPGYDHAAEMARIARETERARWSDVRIAALHAMYAGHISPRGAKAIADATEVE